MNVMMMNDDKDCWDDGCDDDWRWWMYVDDEWLLMIQIVDDKYAADACEIWRWWNDDDDGDE